MTGRLVPLDGSPNFRDFGLYPTTEGRWVRGGFLYRSGHLSDLSERDRVLLGGLSLDLICDFRREDEQLSEPSLLPHHHPPRIVSVPITPGSNASFFEQAGTSEQGGREVMFQFMVEINRDFALNQVDAYRRMFAEILAVENARFLLHCAAGKDRTGFAAAIMLLALGVSRDVVLQDYLLSAEYFIPEREVDRLRHKYEMDLDTEFLRPMLEVYPDYLQAALTAIDEQFDSMEAYLEEVLGVDAEAREELRRRYVSESGE